MLDACSPAHVCSVPSMKRRAWRAFPSQLIPVRRCLSLTHSLVALRAASVCLCVQSGEGSGGEGAEWVVLPPPLLPLQLALTIETRRGCDQITQSAKSQSRAAELDVIFVG